MLRRCPSVWMRSISSMVFNLRAERGQFVGVIGPNGAGKSTLLRAISNVLGYQDGSVSLHGADLKSLPARKVAELLALVPQNRAIHAGIHPRSSLS